MLQAIISLYVFSLFSLSVSGQDISQQAKPVSGKSAESVQKTTKGTQQENEVNKYDLLSLNQRRALDILSSLLRESEYIDDAQDRIRVQVQIADALWPYDTDVARQQFKDSFLELESLKSKRSGEIPSPVSENASSLNDKLRRLTLHTLRLLARHDATFADSLARFQDTREQAGLSQPETKGIAQLRLRLAMEYADKYPKSAAAVVEDALKSEISELLIGAVIAIRRKSPELADELFSKVLVMAESQLSYCAYSTVDLLGDYVIENKAEKFISNTLSSNRPGRLIVERYLRFVRKVFECQVGGRQSDIALELSKGYWLLHRLLPLYEAYLPDEVGIIRANFEELSRKASPRLKEEAAARSTESSAEFLLSKAEETSDQVERDRKFMRAALLVAERGDVEKALFITLRMGDSEKKQATRSIINYQAGRKEALAGNARSALRYAREIDIPVQRWKVFIEASSIAISRDDSGFARESLREIEDYVGTLSDLEAEKALGLFEIAGAWTKVDVSRAFDSARLAVKALNRADFSRPISKLRSRITRDQFEFESLWDSLSQTDFDQALGIARSIEKKDLAVISQIAICRSLLLRK